MLVLMKFNSAKKKKKDGVELRKFKRRNPPISLPSKRIPIDGYVLLAIFVDSDQDSHVETRSFLPI